MPCHAELCPLNDLIVRSWTLPSEWPLGRGTHLIVRSGMMWTLPSNGGGGGGGGGQVQCYCVNVMLGWDLFAWRRGRGFTSVTIGRGFMGGGGCGYREGEGLHGCG